MLHSQPATGHHAYAPPCKRSANAWSASEAGPLDLLSLLRSSPLWQAPALANDPAARACLRAASSAIRNLADGSLITSVTGLKLGWDKSDIEAVGGVTEQDDTYDLDPVQFREDPSQWPPAQQHQQQKVQKFLRRLCQLTELRVSLGEGGASQLSQLLELSCAGMGSSSSDASGSSGVDLQQSAAVCGKPTRGRPLLSKCEIMAIDLDYGRLCHHFAPYGLDEMLERDATAR